MNHQLNNEYDTRVDFTVGILQMRNELRAFNDYQHLENYQLLHVSHSFDEAVNNIASRQLPDLYLIDTRTEQGANDGIQFAQYLKDNEIDIPIVFVADHYIPKLSEFHPLDIVYNPKNPCQVLAGVSNLFYEAV